MEGEVSGWCGEDCGIWGSWCRVKECRDFKLLYRTPYLTYLTLIPSEIPKSNTTQLHHCYLART